MPDNEPKPVTVVPARQEEAPLSQPCTWWERYRVNASSQLTAAALEILRRVDARYMVEKALPVADGELKVEAWGEDGLRTGMVIGSVQSGKTASMLGVADLALDQGVDVVVLLAGTRVGALASDLRAHAGAARWFDAEIQLISGTAFAFSSRSLSTSWPERDWGPRVTSRPRKRR